MPSFQIEYSELRRFVVRLGEKAKRPIGLQAFESTVTSFAKILSTVNAGDRTVSIPDGVMAQLATDYQSAGGRIYDAPGTPLRLLSCAKR